MKKSIKIFMGLSETSGYYSNLNKGFKEIGQESVFIDLGDNKHKYCGDDTPHFFIKAYKRLFNFKETKNKSHFLFKSFIKFALLILKVLIFFWAILNYDVFIFAGSSTFFRYFDYPILKFLGKQIVKVHLGSGSRPPFLDGAIALGGYTGHIPSIDELINLTAERKKELMWMDRYIDILIDHPPQAYFHEREFISSLYIGIPFSTDKFINISSIIENINESDTVKILHAPSYAGHKGTEEIRITIRELMEKGYKIEYKELTNLPNEVVLKEIQKCDFVIDELYSDTPMATFSAEAAFFGKPSIVGGYYARCLNDYYQNLVIPPTAFCHPDEFKDKVIKMASDKEYRKKLGLAAQEYVLNNWAPKNVALKYLQIINGDFPQHWLFDPAHIKYINGYGMQETKLREIVRCMFEKNELKSLQLMDKPELEKKFYDFLKS